MGIASSDIVSVEGNSAYNLQPVTVKVSISKIYLVHIHFLHKNQNVQVTVKMSLLFNWQDKKMFCPRTAPS